MKNATNHEVITLHRIAVQAAIQHCIDYVHIPEVMAALDDLEHIHYRLEVAVAIVREQEEYEQQARDAAPVLRF